MGTFKGVLKRTPDKIKKKYWSIGEIAEEGNTTQSAIRFWEREEVLIRPKIDNKGNRQYTEKQKERVLLTISLIKEGYYTMHGAREIILPFVDQIIKKVPLQLRRTDEIHKLIMIEVSKIWKS